LATLVRKTEPKPLRIFLEDGDHDLNIYAGDWWMANQNMLSALTWAGYEVNHSWGDGGHNGKHAALIMPEALKWLWKDYPASIQAHESPEQRLDLTINEESWKEVQLNQIPASQLTVNKDGEIFFTNEQSIFKLDQQNNPRPFTKLKGNSGGIASDEKALYAGDLTNHQIVVVDKNGSSKTLIPKVDANFIAVASNGIYFSDTNKKRIGFYSFNTKDVKYTIVESSPTGLAISAEKTFLNVAMADNVFGHSFRIDDDGSLSSGQDYIHYHISYGSLTAKVTGMTVDSANILYSATNMGIQVSDQLGRINFIFSKPGDGIITDVKLGGENLSTLYVTCGGKLYARRTNARGILSWQPAVKPPRPGL
jgi:sugar lactone lactonase YvrE